MLMRADYQLYYLLNINKHDIAKYILIHIHQKIMDYSEARKIAELAWLAVSKI